MKKTYQPDAIETRWYPYWETHGCFKPSGQGEPFCILLPPPNVTGTLHMGHAFQHTLMDVLVRAHRMRGCNTLWQMGTDHAGIATEMVVNRNLAREGAGETRDSLGRAGFIEKIWDWKHQSGDTIERQMRRLGASGDWSRSVFTMDEMPARAVIEAFVRLFDDGLIYRGQRLVNWDPVLKTAISDLEVENREVPGHMWHFKYPLAGGATYEYIERDADGQVTLRETRDYISIATTRPETMLGDGAVAVHPADERYAPIVGKLCEIPVGPKQHRRLIPIITDEYPDPEFGSGAVKITGAHDFNDYQVARRNSIPLYALMDDTARMRADGLSYEESAAIATRAARGEDIENVSDVNLVPEELRGLDRFEARERVIAAIGEEGLAVTDAAGEAFVESKSIMQPFGDRSGVVIEPYLTDQWFVKMETLGKRGLELVERTDGKPGEVEFVPHNWINTYRHWLENIQDWCISRQLWWGHRIPAWYDEAGNIYVGHSQAEVRAKHGLGADVRLSQDNDVLETWFSSALWPFSTMGWPDSKAMATRGFDPFVPTNVLVTGFDIIFFWVARMIMLTDHFTDRVPFHEVYIHGLIRDRNGQKMSKSKGNVLDPLDLIDGIELEPLVAKRTQSLMQPQMARQIEHATREEFPDGIPAFGADALRFTFAALASPGRDIKFDLSRCEGYRNFLNKLWNASRFVLMNVGEAPLPAPNFDDLDPAARWIRSCLGAVITQVDEHLAAYRFDLATGSLYDFVWGEFCDWYLELSKPLLADDADPAAWAATRHTLAGVLETILRLLHPFVPYITEELWQQVKVPAGVSGESIMTAPWPKAGARDAQAEADLAWLKGIIQAVRSARTELNLAPGKPLPLLIQHATNQDRERLDQLNEWIYRLARVERYELVDENHNTDDCVVTLAGNLRLLIPLAGLVDIGEELARLKKQLDRERGGLTNSQAKLSNQRFVANAPEAVVTREKTRLAAHETAVARLEEQIRRLEK